MEVAQNVAAKVNVGYVTTFKAYSTGPWCGRPITSCSLSSVVDLIDNHLPVPVQAPGRGLRSVSLSSTRRVGLGEKMVARRVVRSNT